MKKTLIAIAFIAAGALAFNVNAANTKSDNKECGNKTECCKKDKAERGRKGQFAKALEGIQLTEQQQTALNELNTKRAEARKARKAEDKEAKAKNVQDAKNGRLEYLKEVQKILTPEQYVTFLENTAVSAHHGHKAGKVMRGKRDKMARNGNEMNRNKKQRKGDGMKLRKAETAAPAASTAL